MDRLASSFEVFACATVLLLLVVFELTSRASRGGNLATNTSCRCSCPISCSRPAGQSCSSGRSRASRTNDDSGARLHSGLRPHVDRRPGLIALQEVVHALLLSRPSKAVRSWITSSACARCSRAAQVLRRLVLEERLDLGAVRGVAEARTRATGIQRAIRAGAARRAGRSSPSGTPTPRRASSSLAAIPRASRSTRARRTRPRASARARRGRRTGRGSARAAPRRRVRSAPVRRLLRLREERLEELHVPVPRGDAEDGGHHERVDRPSGPSSHAFARRFASATRAGSSPSFATNGTSASRRSCVSSSSPRLPVQPSARARAPKTSLTKRR